MMRTLLIASDHAGLALKQDLLASADAFSIKFVDLGTNSTDSVDYPDYAHKLCLAIPNQAEAGLLICGTGIGMSIAANRHDHIRAALCHDHLTAHFARLHNDANVLVLGARVLGIETAKDCLRAFLNTDFGGGRHITRIHKLSC